MPFSPSHPFENQEVDLLGPNQNFAKKHFAKYSPLIATVAKNIFDVTSGGPSQLYDVIKETLIETTVPNRFTDKDKHDAMITENLLGIKDAANALARMCWDQEPAHVIRNWTENTIVCLEDAAMHHGYYDYQEIYDAIQDLYDHLADILVYWSKHIRKYCRVPGARSALGVFGTPRYHEQSYDDAVPMKIPPTLSPEFIRTPRHDPVEDKIPYAPAKPVTVREISHSDFIPIELFPSKVQSIVDIPPPFGIAGVEPIVP